MHPNTLCKDERRERGRGEREMKEFSYKDVEAATKGFAVDRLIGKGSHGCVYKGTLKGGKLVAVKKPSLGLHLLHDTSKLDNEIAILESIHNPNVVSLLGIAKNPAATHEKLLVMELMPNGSLHDLLHSSPDPPTWPRRALIALQIAGAVLALHESSPAVVHRDIKPANVLFDRRRNARLSDFSLAVDLSTRSTAPAGTIGYLDPCYTAPEKLGPENDVFSFGVLLLELVSGRRAMDVECEPASIVSWAVPAIRGRRWAELCDRRAGDMAGPVTRMLGVAARCVSWKAERRPAMAEVVAELRCVVEDVGCPFWVYRLVRAWRRRASKRVTTATKIVCRDHLIDDDQEEEDEQELEGVGA